MKQIDKEVVLYGGLVKIKYFDQYHQYFVNGEKALGVTAITGLIDKSRPLMYWATKLAYDYLAEIHIKGKKIELEDIEIACKLHMQKKKEAADFGTQVHEWAEKYIKAKVKERRDIEMPKDPRVLNGVIAFLKWVESHKIKFLESERIVYSKKHKYIGTMDCVFTMGTEKHKVRHIGEFKTSSGIYEEMIFQITAYEEAYREETGENCGDKYILRFDKKTAEFEPYRIPTENHKKDISAFLGLLAAKKRLIELEQYHKNPIFAIK
ncbi:MAG: hypothetical protein ABIM64_05540 [candidate division WOR-3 bacterium]